MSMSQQSVTVSLDSPGVAIIAVGPETFTFPLDRFRSIWNGEREPLMLIFQMFLALRAAGLNPNTATLAQMKAAIEAQTYWWGN